MRERERGSKRVHVLKQVRLNEIERGEILRVGGRTIIQRKASNKWAIKRGGKENWYDELMEVKEKKV